MLSKEVEAGLEAVDGHEELVLAEDCFLLTRKRQLIFITHHDRFFGTNFLTEAAEDAAKHVDLKTHRVTFLLVLGL